MSRYDSCVTGGDSYLVDAWYVARQMQRYHPQEFATLTRVPATFQKIHLNRYNTTQCNQGRSVAYARASTSILQFKKEHFKFFSSFLQFFFIDFIREISIMNL